MARTTTDQLPQTSGDSIAGRLRADGIGPTRQRVEIARVLFRRSQHVCAEQLMDMVRAEGRVTVSKATVYNTLRLFADAGLVREVLVDPSKVFYDSNTSEHHHLYDLRTGTLTDIAPGTVRLEELPSLPEGTIVDNVDVVIKVRSDRD